MHINDVWILEPQGESSFILINHGLSFSNVETVLASMGFPCSSGAQGNHKVWNTNHESCNNMALKESMTSRGLEGELCF
jgi:hypothetical protein